MVRKLTCYLDGDALCVVNDDFINLQESDCVFLPVTAQDMKAIKALEE